MINGYSIKKINGQEVLYLYLDFNYEFGSFKDNKDKIKKQIKDFIIKNKIAFKGSIIALVVGGMVTGSMKVKNIENINNIDDNRIVISDVLDNNVVNTNIDDSINVDDTISAKEIDEEKIADTIPVVEDSNVSVDENVNNENIIKTPIKIDEKIDNNVTKNIEHIEETVTKDEPIIEETITEETEPVIEENIPSKTYVTIYRNNGQIIDLELEDYIVGVVSAEMPAAFHIEALKAQSILARTYALKTLNSGKILTDNESTQSFKDNSQLRSLWGSDYDIYYNKIASAVQSTEGMTLTYNGNYIEAVYHSTSNGTTENAVNVWGNYFPYLISVDSSYDNLNPSFIFDKIFSFEELTNKLGIDIDANTSFNILDRTSGNRVGNIEVNGKTFTGTKFRNLLGLRSTDFDINILENSIVFTTRGYGHGVGMSQYGANGMAKNGYSYVDILYHYYPGTVINY